MFDALKTGDQSKGNVPPELFAVWPPGLDASYLHVVEPLESIKRLTFCDTSAVKRGVPYELLVANALVGRWLLLWLMNTSAAQPHTKRVALSDVLGHTRRMWWV